VMLPLMVAGTARGEARDRARAALERVGLQEKADNHPLSLSGGEQQRVAIARAIVHRPQIILADEPTANLDRDSANQVLDILKTFNRAGVTCLVSTHDEHFLASARRVMRLNRGRLVSQGPGLGGAGT
jgi:cell division transport system ATP-binding protein